MRIKALLLLPAIVACAISLPVLAQGYPDRPVKLVVGFPAGGALDNFARGLAIYFQSRLKQPFVVENKSGASEMVAAAYVAKSKPDGYTLFVSTEAPFTQNQFLYAKMPYNPESDLKPVSLMTRTPMLMVASPNFPANNAKEFIAVARARSTTNPVSIASGGVGGPTHLPIAMLAKNEGFVFNHIPYGGIPPMIPDLKSSTVDATIAVTSVLLPFAKDNIVKALAVQGDVRLKMLPNVPTFKELGIKDIKAELVFGLSGPNNMPDSIVETLAGLAKDAVSNAGFREKFMDPYAMFAIGSSPSEFSAFILTDREYQRERVRLSGAKLD